MEYTFMEARQGDVFKVIDRFGTTIKRYVVIDYDNTELLCIELGQKTRFGVLVPTIYTYDALNNDRVLLDDIR